MRLVFVLEQISIKSSINPYRLGIQMSLKHAENKVGKPKKAMHGSFLWKHEIFWIGLIKP